jgi:type I restriction enzyme M protein
MDFKALASIYREAHNMMRNIDGLQPQESFDELLKFLFFKENDEGSASQQPDLVASIDPKGRFTLPAATVAKQIRGSFKAYVKDAPPAIRQVWPDAKLKLSDECLASVASIFAEVSITDIGLDVRSAALREFVPPEIRKGLGIYLTPDEIVRASVEIVAPTPDQRVLDPACGSGTFLLEVARLWGQNSRQSPRVWGIDKNPRMLALADLNLGHVPWLTFNGLLQDSLFDIGNHETADWFNSFDCIFTNPPFGVYIDPEKQDAAAFTSCIGADGRPYPRQQSEIIFIEQCFRLLKPGGRLAIVLPRSVVTNHSERVDLPRRYFGTQGYVEGLMTLPPETFYATGTQTNTVVLFARKYKQATEASEPNRMWLAEVTNCGYDSTGRPKPGGQLARIAAEVRQLVSGGDGGTNCRWLGDHKKQDSFSLLPSLLASDKEVETEGIPLGELTEVITTGRTPGRSAYSDEGLFLVKVGNLSGKGIEWAARDRNFIPLSEREKRKKSNLLLQIGDILMTSSAHSPVYIAKKVDIITEIPEFVGGAASFVGEVMLIRAKPDRIDPFILLAFLRSPAVMAQLQGMVRGQTAHLHPKDVAMLKVPHRLLEANSQAEEIAAILKEEARLARESSQLQWNLESKLAALEIA